MLFPPAPLQVNEYEALAFTAPVVWTPLLASGPTQPSEAVHEVALVEFHVSVEAEPGAMTDGLNVKLALGMTLTTASALGELPPAPAHDNEYEVAMVIVPLLWLPLGGSVPLQPPEAVHEAASVEVQVSKLVPPDATTPGADEMLAEGGGMNATVAVEGGVTPPGPVHTIEYSVVVKMAAVC
jgi:hypothetical protein